MDRRISCGAVVLVGVLLFASSALAHAVSVFAHAHDDSIHGEVSYFGGIPAKNAKVTALDPSGVEIGETTTDEDGKFTLKARFRCDHRLLVDTGDGHGAEFTVGATQLSQWLPPRDDVPKSTSESSSSSNEQLEAIREQIVELRKQLDGYERKVRLHDVLGGIGYILGIAGVAFCFLGGRRKQA